MNKILVPVDFSDTSLNALSYAIQLFGDSEVEFTVLHTYEVSTGAFRMKSIDWILEEDAQREMDALVKRMQREEPGVVLKTKIMKSNAVSAITSLGNSGSYDFIIMGTKGASGLKEVFIGSVASGVISKTKAPVLVVPSNYLYQSWNEIVFAIGNIPLSSASVVNPLRELAMLHSCKINVLHIAVDEKLDYLEEVLSTIEDLSPSVIYTFGAGNINERLNDYLTENDTSLLCLIRSKKDFFSRIFDESVTLKQTFNSPIPLLILHN
jgi:nucleotide-binding universal stress UspA family protein